MYYNRYVVHSVCVGMSHRKNERDVYTYVCVCDAQYNIILCILQCMSVRGILTKTDGLAIDWISNKLYWTDATRTHVSVSDLEGEKRAVLFSDDMKRPRGIALDPTTGLVRETVYQVLPVFTVCTSVYIHVCAVCNV